MLNHSFSGFPAYKPILLALFYQVSKLPLFNNYLAGCGGAIGCLLMALPELDELDLRGCRLKVLDIEALADVLQGRTLKVRSYKSS